LDEFKWLKQRVKEELDLVLLEGDSVGLELVDVVEERSVIAILRNDVGFSLLLIGFYGFGEGSLVFVEIEHFFIYLALTKGFNSGKTNLLVDSKVHNLLVVLEVILVLLEANPVPPSLLGYLLPLLHVAVEPDFRGVLAGHSYQVFKHFALRERQHFLLNSVDFASHPAQNQRKGVFGLEGYAVVPGKLDSVVSKLDVFLSSKPAESRP